MPLGEYSISAMARLAPREATYAFLLSSSKINGIYHVGIDLGRLGFTQPRQEGYKAHIKAFWTESQSVIQVVLFNNGVFVVGRAKKCVHSEEAMGVEAIALQKSVRFARLQGIQSIILEGDSIQFLKSIQAIDIEEHAESRAVDLDSVRLGLKSLNYYQMTMVGEMVKEWR
ncbi:unnamed protein product [Ilex paraguariensis]|uniref:RNase H type-1 domain-containing protein n=1 Tax=Ilex paraguariensis TaxID=185542 RepID=A0ABC8UBG5_9AQUA